MSENETNEKEKEVAEKLKKGEQLSREDFLALLKAATSRPYKVTVEHSETDAETKKRLGMDFEVETTYRLGSHTYKAVGQFPIILVADLDKVGMVMASTVKNAIDDSIEKERAFEAGLKAGMAKAAAQKPATEAAPDATTSPSEKPDAPTEGAEA